MIVQETRAMEDSERKLIRFYREDGVGRRPILLDLTPEERIRYLNAISRYNSLRNERIIKQGNNNGN